MKFIKKNRFLRNFTCNNLSKPWAEKKYQQIKSYLNPGQKIIDIGAGKCVLTQLLQQKGYSVIALDVQNLSLVEEIEPLIYNGEQIPFPDKSFDKALLLTVLHHTHNPQQILREASRVAREVIIIEDIYTNTLNRYLTYFMDSLMNFEFSGHPHNNKTDLQWQKLFKKLNLKIKDKKKHKVFHYFQQITYHLLT